MTVIEARGLGHRFGARVALQDLDLAVAAGESLAVLGENGSGKTTLLRILATVTRPGSGQLKLFGLDSGSQRQRLRERLGYVGHGTGIYPSLTALENLEFFCALHALPRRRAAEVLVKVGLGLVGRRHAGQLSRGMQQRLALGRAILHEPELLLLDEPDAGLDEAGRELLGELRRGRTLVFATHDRALAESLAGRRLVLGGGRVEPSR